MAELQAGLAARALRIDFGGSIGGTMMSGDEICLRRTQGMRRYFLD
jgi:hypothetical protein